MDREDFFKIRIGDRIVLDPHFIDKYFNEESENYLSVVGYRKHTHSICSGERMDIMVKFINNGIPLDLDALKGDYYSEWKIDKSYFPCNVEIMNDSYAHEIIEVQYGKSRKAEMAGKLKKDKITEFFFPEDKMNPNRDPDSPWEFL